MLWPYVCLSCTAGVQGNCLLSLWQSSLFVPSREAGVKPCAPDGLLQNAPCLLGSPVCCVVSKLNIQMCSLGHDIRLAFAAANRLWLAPNLGSALLRFIFLEHPEGSGGRLWQSYCCTYSTCVPCQSFQPSIFALGWCAQHLLAQVEVA